jgi:hypothetical protein
MNRVEGFTVSYWEMLLSVFMSLRLHEEIERAWLAEIRKYVSQLKLSSDFQ